jgi:phage shock protein PspC (stress-responsive transcriptional regulator)
MARRQAPADHQGMTTHSSPMPSQPLARSTTDTKVAGVSGGLGRHFDVDPVLFRVGFAVTTLFSGAGLLAYLVLWALVPREDGAPVPSTPAPIAA